jgi:hypothetical protein
LQTTAATARPVRAEVLVEVVERRQQGNIRNV